MEFAGTGPGSGSIIPEADPRIRIRIKMKRIRNTVENTSLLDYSFLTLYTFPAFFAHVNQQQNNKTKIDQ